VSTSVPTPLPPWPRRQKAVAFLTEDCSLVHGAVALPSLYVDEAGEFKLSGLELVSPLTEADSLLVVRGHAPSENVRSVAMR